jgi:hypothetical protein
VVAAAGGSAALVALACRLIARLLAGRIGDAAALANIRTP